MLLVNVTNSGMPGRFPLEEIPTTIYGQKFNDVFIAFGAIFAMFSFYMLQFHLRTHPLLVIRCPHVFMFDVCLNALNCSVQSLMNTNSMSAPIGCQPFTGLVDGFDVASTMILIGRAALFYNQAANLGKIKRQPVTDAVMDIIAWFTASGDYFANKNIRRMAVRVAENPEAKAKIFQTVSTPWGMFLGWTTSGGFTRYLIVAISWFLVGLTYSMLSTTLHMGRWAFRSRAGSPLACWTEYVQPFAPFIYFGFFFIFIFVMFAVWDKHDRFGLRNDVLWSLVFSGILKTLNGLSLMIPFSDTLWEYMYCLAVVSPVISMSYLLYYVYVDPQFGNNESTAHLSSTFHDEDFDATTFELRRAIMYMKGPNQFRKMNTKMERFWNTTPGKKQILEMGSKFYILESLRFLGQSDSLLDSSIIDLDQYVQLYENYIRVDSQWELNLSYEMREQYLSLLVKHRIGNYHKTNASVLNSGSATPSQQTPQLQLQPQQNADQAVEQARDPRLLPRIFHEPKVHPHHPQENNISTMTILTHTFSSHSLSSHVRNQHQHELEEGTEALTDLIFKIRSEIFQMIDPMIRADLHTAHHRFPVIAKASSPSKSSSGAQYHAEDRSSGNMDIPQSRVLPFSQASSTEHSLHK